jgi:GT2 family glycosyltransferase
VRQLSDQERFVNSILVSIVLYRSPKAVFRCIESLLNQDIGNTRVQILVSDNNSGDNLLSEIREHFRDRVRCHSHKSNLGFAAAQNFAATIAIEERFDALFLVNPDSRYESNALRHLFAELQSDSSLGGVGALLVRADETLEPVTPRELDSAGMTMSRSLRHLDSTNMPTEINGPQLEVFGCTGASLMLSRACIEEMALDVPEHAHRLFRIYPQLAEGYHQRLHLFDEAFFAYREDADLAWRGRLLGWRFAIIPKAIGYHTRTVLPERRGILDPYINYWSVRNRYLMQLNNYSFAELPQCLLSGVIARNILVLLATLIIERSSVKAFRDLWILLPRALARRNILRKQIAALPRRERSISAWFN